jgi:hypothetical protein
MEMKNEHTKQVLLKLSASQRAKEVEEMQLLQAKNLELRSQVTRQQADLDALSAKLQDMTEKIKEASSTLADCNEQLKSKKLSMQYCEKKGSIDGKSTSDELAALCSAIKNAFTCLKGKHRSTKTKLSIEGLLS